jgi:hypothetical protein
MGRDGERIGSESGVGEKEREGFEKVEEGNGERGEGVG